MKKIILVFLLVFIAVPSLTLAAEVRNLKVGQEGDTAVATYDLVETSGEQATEVSVVIVINGQRRAADQLRLTGDFGKNIKVGRGKRIVWNAMADLPADFDGELKWDVRTVEKGKTAGAPPAKSFTDPNSGMEFIQVTGGCYQMGDTFGDGRPDEKPAHQVCVDDFSIGKHLVTQAQWQAVMGRNPSTFRRCGPNCPVESVSWEDVQEFIRLLNEQTGKNYRLPYEAEWEYAARSGGQKELWAGTSDQDELGSYAWFWSNSGNMTHQVGTRRPNSLGLYDMSGNIWQWCKDWYDENYYGRSPEKNPRGPVSGTGRVMRGGGYSDTADVVRVGYRYNYAPSTRFDGLGFRLVLPAVQ